MNKRIEELIKQCDGLVINKMMTGRKQYVFLEDDFIKFTELIVKECIKVMDATAKQAWDNCTYMREEIPTVAHQIAIREHFGVEE